MDENMQGINFNTPKKLAMPLDASFARHEKELLKRAEAINASFARYEKAINSRRKKTRKDFIIRNYLRNTKRYLFLLVLTSFY